MINKSILLFFGLVLVFSLSVGVVKFINYMYVDYQTKVKIAEKERKIAEEAERKASAEKEQKMAEEIKKQNELINTGGFACPENSTFNSETNSCEAAISQISEPSLETTEPSPVNQNMPIASITNELTDFMSGSLIEILSIMMLFSGAISAFQTGRMQILMASLMVVGMINFLPTMLTLFSVP